MKILELRGFLKERRIKGYSTLKKSELEAKVREIGEEEKAEKYEQNLRDTALCAACLNEQRIQRKIDDRLHNERLLESTLRILVCNFCKHTDLAQNGDDTICTYCGALQSSDAVAAVRYRQ